jgi:hypothetical protein
MEEQGRAFALERNLDTRGWTTAQFESYAGMCPLSAMTFTPVAQQRLGWMINHSKTRIMQPSTSRLCFD